jgi:CubicO group peptidase (beta-lactamase class C family)
MVPDLWFDWDAVCDRVAAMTPMWAPGTASGYGPQLWGYVAGEIFRRADGRMLGRALAEEFARPFGLDLYIGLPESEDARLAELRKPPGLSDFGERNEPTKAAFLQPWSSPRSNSDQWRRVENPAANGITTASAAARLLGVMATGAIGGRRVLSPETIAAAGRERICGPDLVLPHTVSWGAGFMRSGPDRVFGPDPDAFGHYGWGGSCGMADPRRGLSAAYVTTRQSIALVADPRALRLIGALYAAF